MTRKKNSAANTARLKRINAEAKRLRKENPKMTYLEALKKAGKKEKN